MDFESIYWIYALGFLGQALFGARLIVQLILSEKEHKVVSPTIFWQLSIGASFLFLIYGILRSDVIIIFGQIISYYIYIRNLQLKNQWRKIALWKRLTLLMVPLLTLSIALMDKDFTLEQILADNDFLHPLIGLGAIGQLMLNFRFLYQWYYSEKLKDSVLPLGFWVISTIASVFVILYAWHKHDPVLLVAQGLGIFVYVRNIFIHYRSNLA